MFTFLFNFVFQLGCMDYAVNRRFISDSFEQPSRESGVDILWIVDNSASMFEEQDQLAAHADSFIGYLSMVPVDFQLAVATTDMSIEEPGIFVDDVLNNDTANLADAFRNQVYLPEGSRDEEGFSAALKSLNLTGPNGESLRSNADLEVVFFTDEDDQSEMDASSFLDQLYSIRPSVNIAVNAIVGDPPEGCASIFGAADSGTKYQSATEQSKGLRESICSLDYDAMLNRIALKVLGLQNTFKLSAAPDLATLEVRVDEALIHRRKRHGWHYNAGTNTIVLDGYSVPYPGSYVIIRYAEWIGPQDEFASQVEEEEE